MKLTTSRQVTESNLFQRPNKVLVRQWNERKPAWIRKKLLWKNTKPSLPFWGVKCGQAMRFEDFCFKKRGCLLELVSHSLCVLQNKPCSLWRLQSIQVFMQNPCLMLKDTRCQCLMHFRSWLALGEHAKEKLHKFLCLAGQRQKCEVSWSVEFWQLQCLLTLRPSPGGSLSFVRPQANQVGDHHHKESPMFRSVKWSQKTKGKCLGNPSPKTGASKKRVLPVLCKTVPDSLAPFFV